MIWNSIHESERLRLWKDLRDNLKDLSFEERLDEVARFCSSMPRGPRSLDYYSPETWPTPWEILFHGSLCVSSVSLLMYYTLTILDDPTINIELCLVKDSNNDYLLPVVNDQFVLNYEPGTVSEHSEVCDYFIVMQKFSKNQIKTIN